MDCFINLTSNQHIRFSTSWKRGLWRTLRHRSVIPMKVTFKTRQSKRRSQSSHWTRFTVNNPMDDVDTGTELKLFFAFQRRHLSFEMMGLLPWRICQTCVEGWPWIFFILIEIEGSLKAKTGSDPPLDEPFKRLMRDRRINTHLVPMPEQANPKPPERPPIHLRIRRAWRSWRMVEMWSPAPQLPQKLQGLIRTCRKDAVSQSNQVVVDSVSTSVWDAESRAMVPMNASHFDKWRTLVSPNMIPYST